MKLSLDNNRNKSKTDYTRFFSTTKVVGHELNFLFFNFSFIMSSEMKTKLFISENVVIAIRH